MTQERSQRPKSRAKIVASLRQSLGLLIQRHASCMGPWWAAYLKLLKYQLSIAPYVLKKLSQAPGHSAKVQATNCHNHYKDLTASCWPEQIHWKKLPTTLMSIWSSSRLDASKAIHASRACPSLKKMMPKCLFSYLPSGQSQSHDTADKGPKKPILSLWLQGNNPHLSYRSSWKQHNRQTFWKCN